VVSMGKCQLHSILIQVLTPGVEEAKGEEGY
jgi:hypothetical protein